MDKIERSQLTDVSETALWTLWNVALRPRRITETEVGERQVSLRYTRKQIVGLTSTTTLREHRPRSPCDVDLFGAALVPVSPLVDISGLLP